MKTIDISQEMINIRQEDKAIENAFLSNNTLPHWMRKPFDHYFSTDSLSDIKDSNIISVDFSQVTLKIPKALAASAIGSEKTPWHDQGMISFKDNNGAILSITFNKSSHTSGIDVTVHVTQGKSLLLHTYCGQSALQCSLFDGEKELAALTAAVNHNGTFLYAEGSIVDDYFLEGNESTNSGDFIALHFH
jgi:hypothetical protein